MPWKVPLFSETGELEWYEAQGSRARLGRRLLDDIIDRDAEEAKKLTRQWEEMANEETRRGGEYSGYFGGYQR